VLKDGSKMSKSKGNTVDPQGLIDRYGADTARLFILFAAPPEQHLEWSDSAVEGAYRFLNRFWRLVHEYGTTPPALPVELSAEAVDLRRAVHQCIDRVSRNMSGRYHFNVAIAAIMELTNSLMKVPADAPADLRAVLGEGLRALTLLLAPFAPHIAEVLWEKLGQSGVISHASWPVADAGALRCDTVTLVIQVNGKLRERMDFPADADNASVEQTVLADPAMQRHLEDKTVRKVIIVPGRLVNVVAG
jgi:leucyl-tRNA synthetase